MIKSTERDFEKFKTECLKWINDLQLNDWDCVFVLEDIPDANARVRFQKGTRKATFRLAQERDGYESVEDSAKHECLELLLADMTILLAGFYADAYIDDETHRVINKLMRVIK